MIYELNFPTTNINLSPTHDYFSPRTGRQIFLAGIGCPKCATTRKTIESRFRQSLARSSAILAGGPNPGECFHPNRVVLVAKILADHLTLTGGLDELLQCSCHLRRTC